VWLLLVMLAASIDCCRATLCVWGHVHFPELHGIPLLCSQPCLTGCSRLSGSMLSSTDNQSGANAFLV